MLTMKGFVTSIFTTFKILPQLIGLVRTSFVMAFTIAVLWTIDECSNCSTSKSILSSDEYLNRSLPLRYFIIFFAFVTVILNSCSIYVKTREKIDKRYLKVDRVILLQATVYDALMGGYLGGLSFVNIYFGSDYCKRDMIWRDSIWCSLTGALFNLSSHGSFTFIVYLAFTRFHKCLRSFSEGVSMVSVLITSLCIHVLNMIYSFAVFVPIKSLQESLFYQIHIKSNMYLQGNESATENINKMFKAYYPSLLTNV